MTRVDEVEAFHEKLGSYKHERTLAVYGTGLECDPVVHFRLAAEPAEGSEGRVENPTRRDGRPWAQVQRAPEARWSEMTDVVHDQAFNNGNVRTLVERLVRRALGGL